MTHTTDFPHRDATPAELHGCVGGMGTAGKLAAVRTAATPRPRGLFAAFFPTHRNTDTAARSVEVKTAGAVCGPNGCN